MFEINTTDPAGTVVPISHTPGSYTWRYSQGLLTSSDHIRLYRAIREPRGSYRVPMRDDLVREVRQ